MIMRRCTVFFVALQVKKFFLFEQRIWDTLYNVHCCILVQLLRGKNDTTIKVFAETTLLTQRKQNKNEQTKHISALAWVIYDWWEFTFESYDHVRRLKSQLTQTCSTQNEINRQKFAKATSKWSKEVNTRGTNSVTRVKWISRLKGKSIKVFVKLHTRFLADSFVFK